MPQLQIEAERPLQIEEERPLASDSAVHQRLEATRARLKQKPPEPVREAVKGAGKSLIGSVATLTGPISRRVLGQTPEQYAASVKDLTERKGTAQQVGGAAEQIGEFFIPGRVAKSMGVLGKIATEAFGNYTVATGQGSEHPIYAAAIAAALAPLSALAPKAASSVKASAEKSMGRALSKGVEVTNEKVQNAIAESVPRALDLGLHPTWRRVLAKAKGVQQVAGKAVENELASTSGDAPVPIQPVVDALTALATKAQNVVPIGKTGAPIGAGAGAARSQPVVFNKRLIGKIDELKSILVQHGPTMEARQLHNIKEDWSNFVWKGAKYAKPKVTLEARAKDAAVGAMRSVLERDAPSIADVDREYHLARQTYDVIADAAGLGRLSKPEQTLTQQAIKASRAAVIGSAVGAGAGVSVGHSAVGALVGSATGVMLEQAMKSAGWRLLGSAAKNRLATALANGDAETVRRIVSPLIAAKVSTP